MSDEVSILMVGTEYAVVVMPDPSPLVIVVGERGPAGTSGADISRDPENALTTGSDEGLFVPDVDVDLLALYLIARG